MKYYKDNRTQTWVCTYRNHTAIANNIPAAIQACLAMAFPNQKIHS